MSNFDADLKNDDIPWFAPFIEIATGSAKYTKTGIKEDLKGIDVYSNNIPIQCKIRKKYYSYDLCIERAHQDASTGEWWKGWIHDKPKYDKFLYGWKECFAGSKSDICLVMDANSLHRSYIENKSEWDKNTKRNIFTSKDKRGREWWTHCTYIPVKELRKHFPIGHYSRPMEKK